MALRLADRLSAARKSQQMSQAAVGAKLNPQRSRKLVWEWEKGRCEPSLETVRQLAKALRVEPCWLAWGIEHRAR